MNAMKDEAIGGINAFLESQQKLPGEARLTLALLVDVQARLSSLFLIARKTLGFRAGVLLLGVWRHLPLCETAFIQPDRLVVILQRALHVAFVGPRNAPVVEG